MEGHSLSRRGNWEYSTSGNTSYSRRVGTVEWTLISQKPAEAHLILMLVRHYQAEAEPNHWSLFLAPEGESGKVYEVRGDATLMHHVFISNINLLASESLKDVFQLATVTSDQAARIDDYATQESPPSAKSQAYVTENCQGWTLRVLRKLIDAGIVAKHWDETLRDMMDPL